jgi:phage tail tape-measure protein
MESVSDQSSNREAIMAQKYCEVCGVWYEEPSLLGAALGGGAGFVGGAKAGALIGSVIPVVGTGVGIALGGTIGWIFGHVKGATDLDWAKENAAKAAVRMATGCIHHRS